MPKTDFKIMNIIIVIMIVIPKINCIVLKTLLMCEWDYGEQYLGSGNTVLFACMTSYYGLL